MNLRDGAEEGTEEFMNAIIDGRGFRKINKIGSHSIVSIPERIGV